MVCDPHSNARLRAGSATETFFWLIGILSPSISLTSCLLTSVHLYRTVYGTLYTTAKLSIGCKRTFKEGTSTMMPTGYAIAAYGVHKQYAGAVKGAGLNGFDLEVLPGKVCGLLGPNGAGKTTAVKILATLLEFDSGQASVAGFDVKTQGQQVRQTYRTGRPVCSRRRDPDRPTESGDVRSAQSSSPAPGSAACRRATGAVCPDRQCGLPVSKYSGGMRRRLDLAASLIVSPPVLFVDEPTTGLDPAGRSEVWSAIRALVESGHDGLADNPVSGRSRSACRSHLHAQAGQSHRRRHAGRA